MMGIFGWFVRAYGTLGLHFECCKVGTTSTVRHASQEVRELREEFHGIVQRYLDHFHDIAVRDNIWTMAIGARNRKRGIVKQLKRGDQVVFHAGRAIFRVE